MSQYLIERIEADDRIDVLTHTEVRALARRRPTSAAVTLEHTPSGAQRTVAVLGPVLLHRRRARDRLARRLRRARPRRVHHHRPFAARRRSRPDRVHGARSAAVRDVAARRVRGRRRAPGIAEARRGRGRRRIERGAIGARVPRHEHTVEEARHGEVHARLHRPGPRDAIRGCRPASTTPATAGRCSPPR